LPVIERYWWLVFVISIGGASLAVLMRQLGISKGRRWHRRIKGAKDDATASKEFQRAWDELVEMAKRSLNRSERDLVEALRGRSEYAEASGQSREEFYEDIGPRLGGEIEIERNAVARFLVDRFAKMKEIDTLRDFLLLVQVGSKTAERAPQVSQTLKTARRIAGGRRKEAYLDDEKRRLGFIAEIFGIYSELWLSRSKYLDNPRKPMEEMQALLGMPQLTGKLVENLKALFGLFQKTLGDFRLAEDSIPLRLAIEGDESARETAIEDMLGVYPAKHGVASVLKYIANQPVFPLIPFLKAIEKAQEELGKQAEEMRKARMSAEDKERRMLFVPDESILNTLLHKFREAVKAELIDRRSALEIEVRNDNIYIEEGARTIILRIAVGNEPPDRPRVGDAWNVRLVASPPLESKTLTPAAGYVSHILPWENNVVFDLIVTFPDELQPGIQSIKLEATFDDLTQRNRVREFLARVELISAEPYLESESLEYDDLGHDEMWNAAGDDQRLRQLLETAIKNRAARGLVSFVDIQQAMDEVAKGSDIEELAWAELPLDEKRALFALAVLLDPMSRAHVRSTEINALLRERYPTQLTNWNRLIRALIGKKLIIDENGLYRFGSKLVQRWIAKHKTTIAKAISWERV